MFVINSADKAFTASATAILTGAGTAIDIVAGWVTNKAVGRESDKLYINHAKVIYGDYNFKSDYTVRPLRTNDNTSLFGLWNDVTKNLIASTSPVTTPRAAFEANAVLNDWALFDDKFTAGVRSGANL